MSNQMIFWAIILTLVLMLFFVNWFVTGGSYIALALLLAANFVFLFLEMTDRSLYIHYHLALSAFVLLIFLAIQKFQGTPVSRNLFIGLIAAVVLPIAAGKFYEHYKDAKRERARIAAEEAQRAHVASLTEKWRGGDRSAACPLSAADPKSNAFPDCRASIVDATTPSARWALLRAFLPESYGGGFEVVSLFALPPADFDWFIETFVETWIALPDAELLPTAHKTVYAMASLSSYGNPPSEKKILGDGRREKILKRLEATAEHAPDKKTETKDFLLN